MAALVRDPPDDFVPIHEQLREGLELEGLTAGRDDLRTDVDGRASATATIAAAIPDFGDLTWEVELQLLRERGTWGLAWQPASLHPEWRPGLRFAVSREVVDRLPIEAVDGTALAGPGERVTFGFEPSTVADPDEVVDAFEDAIPGSGETAERLLRRSGLVDGWFYPVASLPADDAADIDPDLTRVRGILRRVEEGSRGLLADGFAVHVVGRVDEATAEQLEQLAPDYERGDEVGQFGLEAVFEGRLGPAAQATAELRDGIDGPVRTTLGSGRYDGGDSTLDGALRTTLDVTVQRAIENTLLGLEDPAAIVVVDGEDGAIRGSASRPLTAFNRAFEGRYAPGSTSSLVTAEALLADGASPEDDVTCPADTAVDGAVVVNADGTALGDTTLGEAFAASCDTSLARLAADLGTDAMTSAAARFGFGVDPAVPLEAFGGAFPEPTDAAELAVAAVGQGRVELSPLHLASVAAATVTGVWHQPYLLADDGPGERRELADGTATALQDLLTAATPSTIAEPGLAGTTSSAPGIRAGPAWFVGTVDGLGVAVLVEEADTGDDDAAPLAARFVRELQALRDTPADVADPDG
jgi:hypothetical protein